MRHERDYPANTSARLGAVARLRLDDLPNLVE